MWKRPDSSPDPQPSAPVVIRRGIHHLLPLLPILFLSVQSVHAQAPADEPTTRAGRLVFVIPIQGEFEKALHLIVVRALREAKRQEADAVILDMDTPGGRVDSAIRIRDALINTEIPTYTYVNPMAVSAGAFIALATDHIIMGRNSSIGGALPLTIGAEGVGAAEKKFQSVFNAEIRKTARTKGHPEDIAEGFSNPDLVIPGLKKEGDILTLTFDEATSLGLAEYQAETLDELLAREGLSGARVVRFQLTTTDQIARFLSSSAVLGVLMMVGLGALVLELKTPGVGLPGAIALLAFGLAFGGSYLANLSGYMEVIFFFVGVVLLVVEIYVLPGFGIAGILGILCVVGSLLFALFSFAPDGFSLTAPRLDMLGSAVLTVTAALVGLIPFFIVLGKILPATPLYRNLMLGPEGRESPAPAETAGAAAAPRAEAAVAPGQTGRALTDLRPAGIALLGEARVDVLTQGEYLEKGTPVVVVRVEGARVFVARGE